MTEEHWKKFDALTDADVERAIADDPDSAVPEDAHVLSEYIAYPDGTVKIIVPTDRQTFDWLSEHHVDTGALVASLLHDYVARRHDDPSKP